MDNSKQSRPSTPAKPRDGSDVYPRAWDEVAEIRVFRTSQSEWERFISWRADMGRKGWKLLRVNTKESQLVAIFGRTRQELFD